jgi:hypothetical protein
MRLYAIRHFFRHPPDQKTPGSFSIPRHPVHLYHLDRSQKDELHD